ncbi:glycosyl hydrolase [Asticcacaulis tiandongensis]|uniref:glycosyl hydrolase n=1 Tax=Asticcacaulis tiandongensis TaxID=2565365 RepID=UPI001FE72085|nr:glycosyl hydrolase [Asticcacaulis tiandongensis]
MEVSRRIVLGGLSSLPTVMAATQASATSAPLPAKGQLSVPSPSPEAKALYDYLWGIYGKKTLTGQQESTWVRGSRYELNYIKRTTGKLPAIRGLDYIDPKDYKGVNRRAARWYRRENGIPSICWHWGNPLLGTGYKSSQTYFDLPAALTEGTPEHAAMWRDMAIIADHLTVLRDKGVPVLWRPLHEFTGEWFWWGMTGPEAFKALWRAMHTYFTAERGLNNLIWVLGYAHILKDGYYPGRQYVDIAGADIYAKDHGPQNELFQFVKGQVGDTVPICLHENGPIPDPDGLGPDADWLWFLTWHTQWIKPGEHNTDASVRKAYLSERYLTKDELKGFKPPP